MRRKKNLILYVLGFFLLILVTCNFLSKTEFYNRFVFEADYKQMEKVANYLCALEDESVYIVKPFWRLATGPREFKDIEDREIKFAVFLLYAKGYDRIGKNSDQTVYFQKWYDGFERYRGYAFSCDGSGDLVIEYLVDQKEMPKPNWYYYHEDYNQWRTTS